MKLNKLFIDLKYVRAYTVTNSILSIKKTDCSCYATVIIIFYKI